MSERADSKRCGDDLRGIVPTLVNRALARLLGPVCEICTRRRPNVSPGPLGLAHCGPCFGDGLLDELSRAEWIDD